LINRNHQIHINKETTIPIINYSNCKSLNVIYIIYCNLCQKFYIGRTHDIKERITNHIYSIKNFKIFLSEFKCVSFHFHLKGHNIFRDFSFFILESGINDISLQKTKEAFFINFVHKIDKKLLLNDFIPKLYIRQNVITL
jgi:hypothetical protein